MGLAFDNIGKPGREVRHDWTSRDAILYALGVGAGQIPDEELAFTTENTASAPQQALPTFGLVIAPAPMSELFGDVDLGMLVHGEQEIVLHSAIPPAGSSISSATVTGIYDRGSGALIDVETNVLNAESGKPLATLRHGLFLRGAGGFGGAKPPVRQWQRPDAEPDAVVRFAARPDQALIYRLSGDTNPLHSDPEFARQVGFEKPILHGLCTFGFTGRALLHNVAGSMPGRFKSMRGRFSAPAIPGDTLVISIWRQSKERALFRTNKEDGTILLDRGEFVMNDELHQLSN